jgi:hypothetical protein
VHGNTLPWETKNKNQLEEHMKTRLLACASVVVLFVVIAIPLRLTAQNQSAEQGQTKRHTRYQVIDTGSFGGPNSHMSLGAHILNNNGTFTGYADTSEPDPYAPDGCWDGDCLVAHTFRWSHGELTELGVIDAGPNSESNWISENGLIAGDSQMDCWIHWAFSG